MPITPAAELTLPSPDCLGTIQSQDYKLIEKVNSNCTVTRTTTHNITGQGPMLDTLKNNDGSTLTINLLPGSPAIDPAGNTPCITEGQRATPTNKMPITTAQLRYRLI